jgi:hypothetical protein
MTVLLTMDIPAGKADLEAVSAEMGVHQNPPDGLILHLFTETPQGTHVVDVWESAEHFERFRDGQLMPAMGKVMSERGIAMEAAPEPTFTEAHDVIRGK